MMQVLARFWWETLPDALLAVRVWLEDRRDRIGARMARARPYRFEGEQANHAEQLAETRASIASFEAVQANPDATPEERYFLNAHRVGMEDRLAVLEGKPRLTLEELNERDAIETHLYGAPLPRGRLAKIAQPESPRGLLGSVAAASPVAVAANPLTWAALGLALSVGSCSVQTARLNNAKADLSETRADLEMAERNLENASAVNARLAQAVREADVLSQQTAANLEAERARNRALRTRQMERDREAREVLSRNTPPDWTGRLRDLEARTGGDPAAGDRAE